MSLAIGSGRSRFAPPAALYAVVAAHAFAVVLALIAWNGSATKASPTRQMSWVALGSLAVVVSGAVNAVWLVRARRAIGIRQRHLMARIGEMRDQRPSVVASRTEADDLLAVQGMSLYHRPGCVLVDGRHGARPARRTEHEAAGRRPCGWCAPKCPGPGVSPK